MLFFAKFRSHRVKNQKDMTENLSQQNALDQIKHHLFFSFFTMFES